MRSHETIGPARALLLDWSNDVRMDPFHQSLLDIARTLMFGAPKKRVDLWDEAVNTPCLTKNRLRAQSCQQGCTPYEMIQGQKLDVSHLRAFSCKAYLFKPPQLCDDKKFERRTEKGVLVGCCKEDA